MISLAADRIIFWSKLSRYWRRAAEDAEEKVMFSGRIMKERGRSSVSGIKIQKLLKMKKKMVGVESEKKAKYIESAT